MERLQRPFNPHSFERQVGVESLEVQGFINTQSFGLEKEEEVQQFSTPSFEDTMPLLQMLQSGESQPFFPFKEPNFLALLSLPHFDKPWELESYVTQETVDLYSPVKSETSGLRQNPISTSCMEGVNPESNQELPFNPVAKNHREADAGNSSTPCTTNSRIKRKQTQLPPATTKERRKRKRTKTTKNNEEVENQRMIHIAVERNRRRQMNEHLNSLRFLMPPSYIQRGDQASIIGGAIDFVKKLEQLLQSLEAQKRMKQNSKEEISDGNSARNYPTGNSSNELYSSSAQNRNEEQVSIPRVDITVIQNHVNLKVQCARKQGQLLKAIVSLQELRLTVLHLNVASSHASMFYAFNLKMEDDCKLGSSDEIAMAVLQMFNQVDGR